MELLTAARALAVACALPHRAEIDAALSTVAVHGARYPEHHQRLVGR